MYELPGNKKKYLLGGDKNWGDQVILYWALFGYVRIVGLGFYSLNMT